MIVEIRGLTKIFEEKQRVVAVDASICRSSKAKSSGCLVPMGPARQPRSASLRRVPCLRREKSGLAASDVVAAPASARRNIGVVPQYNTLDRSSPCLKTSTFTASISVFLAQMRRRAPQQLLSQFHLQERGTNFPSQLSGGMQQRVQIARAIAHRPAVLFLDEPSAGLDPQSRIAMWDAVKGLESEGITVLLTTHYMEEADDLCDRVAIMGPWQSAGPGYAGCAQNLSWRTNHLRVETCARQTASPT